MSRPRRSRLRKRRVGLTVDVVGAYGRGVVRGVMAFAKTRDWIITMEPRWSFEDLPDVEEWDVEGVVTQVYSQDFQRRVIERGIRATNVSNFVPGVTLPTVLPDDQAVGRLAADYFHDRGFQAFGFYGSTGLAFSLLRLEGFRSRLDELGHPLHVFDVPDKDPGRWIVDCPKPIAVLGCNDQFAHRLLLDCRRQKVAVPEEVAVLGVDDDELINALVTPSLSSIRLPTQRIGFEAARLLDDLLRGGRVGDEPLLLPPGGVITRQSTDVLAVSDEDVATALTFIRQHARDGIGVEDVLEEVPAGRRSLERRFRKCLGRSVLAEIQRVRVDQARQLLVQTDLSMAQVAAACGFSNASRLGIVFRQLIGEPPNAFRVRHRLSAG